MSRPSGIRQSHKFINALCLSVALASCAKPHEPSLTGRDSASARIVQALTIPVVSNASNFNGTAIPAGRFIWFSSVMKVSGVGSQPVHIYFNKAKIQFTAGSTPYSLPVPDAEVTIDPAAASASTTFDASTGTWKTVLPWPWSGNAFLGGLTFAVPVNFPGGINPVTWSGSFESDAPVSLNWQWAAAVYTSFSPDYNAIQVKPLDSSTKNPYNNSDHAGTPEAFKSFVVGGARGGGGSDFTGSLSGTVAVTPVQACAGVTCPGPDQCHLQGSCNPRDGTCSNPTKANGTACSDGNACTQGDTCQQGTCSGGAPVVCTPSDACHLAGMCNPATGICSNPPAPDGGTCGANPCDGAHIDDGNPCTVDSCDPTSGVHHVLVADGTSCSDGNACTTGDSCQAGVCSGSPVVCTAQDQCHDPGSCNPATGACSNPTKSNGTSCSDGNTCTTGDTCQGGICSGNPVVCTAQDQCHDAGSCDPAIGACSNPNKANGTSCNDDNACTQTDSCQAGACVGANPVTCTASDQCHDPGTCDPASGVCSNPNKANGTACNDGNACTQTDSCEAGVCVGANPVACTASDQCHDMGACDQATGVCSNPAKADGTNCSDGNACTQADRCQSGVCVGTNPVVCMASNQCHDAGTCDPSSGVCSNPNKANGTSCNDGNACTQTDSCEAGVCVGANPVACAASDQCHDVGACDQATGVCSNPAKADGTNCSDGNACTQADSCQAGTCLGTNPVVCTASNQCHDAGTCDPSSGVCSNPSKPDDSPCNDGNACTQTDSCQAGTCVGASPKTCVALDACHAIGTCDPASGTCSNPVKADGASCSDGDACNGDETCQAGACTPGTPPPPPTLTLSDVCRRAVCSPQSGWRLVPKPVGTSCANGTICDGAETCDALGLCVPGTPLVTDDNNACTLDSCDPVAGVSHTPVANGTACGFYTCNAGQCVVNQPPVVSAGPDQSISRTLVAPWTTGGLALQTISLGWNNPIGIDYHPPTNSVIVSVNYGSGSPYNFELDAPDGTRTRFSNVSGITDEVYFAVARDEGGGRSLGGFLAGELFHGNPNLPGVIARVAPDGSSELSPWVRLPGEAGFIGRTGISLDRTGVFGGDLLVMTSAGNLWRVSSTGQSTLIAPNLGGDLESVVSLPNDPVKYGPWAGKIVVGGEDQTRLTIVDVNGTVTFADLGLKPENILVIPANENFFGVDYGDFQLKGAPAWAFAGMVGDLLMAEELPGRLWRVHWNGSQFEKTQLVQISQWEHVTFAPTGLLEIPPPAPTVALPGSVTDDGLPAGRSLTAQWSVTNGPGPVKFVNPTSAATSATFTRGGTYVLRLTGSDGDLASSDEATITVVNNAPLVNAGPDISTRPTRANGFPLGAIVSGAYLDDDMSGVPVTTTWTQVSGPGHLTFLDATALNTTVSVPSPGVYVVRFTADDGELSTSDDLTITALTATCATTPAGLVSWWPGDGTGADINGLNNVSLDGGATYASGKVGQAFAFNGLGGYGSAGHGASLNVSSGDFTVDTWVQFNALNPFANTPLVDKMATTGVNTNGWRLLRQVNNHLWFCLGGSAPPGSPFCTPGGCTYLDGGGCTAGGPLTVESTTTVAVNTWYHVAAVKSANVISLYVNGALQASKMLGGSFTDSGQADLLLARNLVEATFLNGNLDEVDVFNRALSASEIQAIYNAGGDGKCVPNRAPAVNAGPDLNVSLPLGGGSAGALLAASVTDDGQPGGPLTVGWSQISGPAAVTFDNASAVATVAHLPQQGSYVLRLSASDGDLSSSDDVTVTVGPPATNAAPVVRCGPDQSVRLPLHKVAISCSTTDDGLPAGAALTAMWSQPSGPDQATFIGASTSGASVSFPSTAGVYTVRLTVTDGELAGFDDVVVTLLPPNQTPVVNAGPDQTVFLPQGSTVLANLAGQVTDDGVPEGAVLTHSWSVVSAPATVVFGDFTEPVTTAQFSAVGTYVLRLSASDSQALASDDVTIEVRPGNRPPTVNAGPDQTITLPVRSAILSGVVSDDGLPIGAAVTSRWSLVSGPGTAVFGNPRSAATQVTFDASGSYVLRLTANDTQLAGSDDVVVNVNALPPTGDPPTVAITAPGDLSTVTAPVDVRGTVTSASLLEWRLEYREKSLGDDWRTIAYGDTPVTDAVLGQFDPTLLLNGIYQLRLVATDTSGRTAATPEDQPALNVRGNMKVGQFALSFLEMSIPVSGIPIQLLRNYDTRDPRNGDFGYGWTLDANGVRVSESGKMGRNWTIVRQPGIIPVFCVQPTRGKHVTVSLPGGRVFEFEAVIDDGCDTFMEPGLVTVGFRALPGTNAKLAPADGGSVLVQEGQLLDANAEIYDPNTYVLTLLDGRSLTIADRTAPDGPGLKSITDLNGNSVTFGPTGFMHSSGSAVTILRDGQSRITSITDPMGKGFTYTYDVDGNLATATDRVGNVTQFRYSQVLPHYLTEIVDPRGVRATRNDYADDGRLISQTDAAGHTTTFTHDISNRRETIIGRDGTTNVVEYDVRGNITKQIDEEGGITLHTYDAHDNETSKTDPNGHTWSHEFDGRDLETKTTDPLGKATTRTYHPLGKVLTETDPLGHTKTNGYDIFGNLVSTKDALDNTTTYVFTPDGANLRTVTDPAGRVTIYTYDRYGFMTVSRDRLGNVTTFTNDANGRRLTESRTRTTPSGVETLVTKFTYDDSGRVVRTEQPDGSAIRTTYNSMGQVATTVDALERTTTMTYDDLGQLIRTTHPDGAFEETTYDESGRRSSSKDAAGRTTSFEYDRVGRLVKTTFPGGAVTRMGYDPGGRQVSATDARGKVTTFGYDDAGRRTTVTDPLSHTTTYGYDEAGRHTSVKDARGFTTSFSYDDADRRTATAFPDGRSTSTGYDQLGQRTFETDQAGRTTTFAYDLEGRLLSVTDALNHVTNYGYDEIGNRVSQIDANMHETRFEYDEMGRQTKRVLPDGKFETKTFDGQGRLSSRTDFMGRRTTFQYDERDRPTLKTYPDTSTVSFTYTAAGRRSTAVDARGTTTYAYDERDRPTQLTYPDGRRLNYTYDAQGNRTSLTATIATTSLTTRFAYDDCGQTTTVTDPDERIYNYGYDENGRPTSLAPPNGVTTTYAYDSLGRLTSLVSKRGTATLASYAYTLGPTGERTRAEDADGTARAYGYDAVYRLTSEAVSGAGMGDYAKDFTYDPVGNRLTQVTTGAGAASLAYGYDSRDRLVSEPGVMYAWDDNGDLLSGSGGATYDWDFDGRLIKVSKVDGSTVEHMYGSPNLVVGADRAS
jgi:YD repeat-containing protein